MSTKQHLEERLKKTVIAMRRTEPDSGIDLCHIVAVEEAIDRLAKFAAFAGPDGEPRKVLGTLPLTADGAIVAANSVIWHPRYGASTCNFEVDSGCWAKTCDPYSPHAGELYEVNECYSTKEAATSALAAAKEKP